MNLIEFIGFIISLIAMIFLFFKKAREQRSRREPPEEHEGGNAHEDEKLKAFLRSIEADMDKSGGEEAPPRPGRPSASLPALRKAPAEQVKNPTQQPKRPYGLQQDEHRANPALEGRSIPPSPQANSKAKPAVDNGCTDPFGARIYRVDLSKSLDVDAYKVIRFSNPSRGLMTIRGLKSLKDMVIYHEVLGAPKGLSKDFQPYKRRI